MKKSLIKNPHPFKTSSRGEPVYHLHDKDNLCLLAFTPSIGPFQSCC